MPGGEFNVVITDVGCLLMEREKSVYRIYNLERERNDVDIYAKRSKRACVG